MPFFFENQVLDPERRELRRAGVQIPVEPQVFDLLLYLARNCDRVVSKDDLIESVWKGRVVSDSTLTSRINAARKAIGDSGEEQRLIRTLPRKGIRFVGDVRVDAGRQAAEPAVSPSPFVQPALPLPDKPSIAVLPFTNMSGDPEQAYFADGVVEDITTALSRFSSLFVIARNSAFAYAGRSVDIRQIGRELGVRYVLEGSIRKAGNRVRITGQLIQADTGTHVWANRYDGDLDDIFALQDRITESVAGAVAPTIEQAEIDRVRRTRPDSLDAYDLYLRAQSHFYEMTRKGHDTGLELLRRAIALDPGYAPLFFLQSRILAYAFAQGWSSLDEIGPRAIQSVRETTRIDRYNADALAFLARGIAYVEQRQEEALAMAERATSLNANSAVVWQYAGWVQLYANRNEEALVQFRKALRLNPVDPLDFEVWAGLAISFIELKRDAEAVDAARQAVQRGPNFTISWRVLVASLFLSGRTIEAREARDEIVRLEPGYAMSRVFNHTPYIASDMNRYREGLRLAGLPE